MLAVLATLLLVASTAAIPSTPWPLPLNLTRGPASATISDVFSFFCDPDPACAASCTTSPLVADAFSRFEARLRPPPGAIASPSYWWRYPGADCDGVKYDLGKNCGVDVSGCEASCAATAGCAGFNTNGVMKNSSCGASGSILPGAGCGGCVDLYLLKDTPEPTSGVLTSVAVCVASGDESLGQATDESYTLAAPSNGTGSLRAATVFGMLHGLESLAQLLDVFGVPPTARVISGAPVFVEDAPRFSYRGLLVDSARHFLPVPQLLHTIDALAWSKLNVLHWHIVDSSSFPCGSATYPQLAAAGAYDPSAVYVSFNANHPAHQNPATPKNKPNPNPTTLNPNQKERVRLEDCGCVREGAGGARGARVGRPGPRKVGRRARRDGLLRRAGPHGRRHV